MSSTDVAGLVRDWKASRAALKRYTDAAQIDHDFTFKYKQHDDRLLDKLNQQGRTKVTSGDVGDVVRYTSAQMSGSPIYLDVRPFGPGMGERETADLEGIARVTKAQLEAELADPDKGYADVRRRMIRLANGARAGAVQLDLVPGGFHDCEVVPSAIPPESLSWPPEYAHFNHYGCPRLYRTVRMSLQAVRNKSKGPKGWKNTELVKADNGESRVESPPNVDRDEWAAHSQQATIVIAWIKDDETEIEVELDTVLDPPQWYMACPTCGYTERDLRSAPGYDGSTLPESLPCPQCGQSPEGLPKGTLARIEVEHEPGKMPAFAERHRKVIFAPCSPKAGLLRDGPWEKGLTNFPIGMLVPDPYPLEAWGNSQTSDLMDVQSLKNAALRAGAEQMERNRDLTIAKENSLWDANHEPYMFDGSGDVIAYTTTLEDLQGIRHIQGSGLNIAFSSWISELNAELMSHRGIGQLSLTPQQIKGTTAETAGRVQESGDVPVDERIRILHEFETLLFTRWLELMAGNYDLERWVEVSGPDGQTAFRSFRGTTLPHLRVRVHAGPDLNAVDLDKALKLRGLAGQSPSLIRFIGKAANIDQALIDAFLKESTLPAAGPTGPGVGGEMPGGAPLPAPMQ